MGDSEGRNIYDVCDMSQWHAVVLYLAAETKTILLLF